MFGLDKFMTSSNVAWALLIILIVLAILLARKKD